MRYLLAMGMSSLSKYRRAFMILGFVIFAGGAIMRWHQKRQLRSVAPAEATTGVAHAVTWREDCVSYACRVVGVHGPVCEEMCGRAVEKGSPHTRSERIANACKAQCVADNDATSECRSMCLIREAQTLH